MEINDQEMKDKCENYPKVIQNDGQRLLGSFQISGKKTSKAFQSPQVVPSKLSAVSITLKSFYER